MPSECGSSEDCDGSPCGLTENQCQQAAGFYCHAAADACLWDSDCPSNERCLYDKAEQPDAGLWTCQEIADCE